MGADTFSERGKGATVQEAFNAARAQALHDYGHRGYTGSLAEKTDFVVIDLPEAYALLPEKYADSLIDAGDSRIDDKWGPAGAIKIADDEWLFFGWASS